MATRVPPTSATAFHAAISENLEDPIFGELMTKAVTVVPCGHVFNEETVIQCLARDRLCPLDRQPIERHVPNYTIRHLAETAGSQPVEEAPTEEAMAHFTKAKALCDQGDYEGGIAKLLQALQLSPTYEKAQAYLDFCLQRSSKTLPAQPSSTPPASPASPHSTAESSSKDRYIDLLFKLLDEADVKRYPELKTLLEQHVEELMGQETVLTVSQKESYKWTEKLIGEDRKVREFVMQKLQQIHASPASPALPKASAPVTTTASNTTSVSSSSLGAANSPKSSRFSQSITPPTSPKPTPTVPAPTPAVAPTPAPTVALPAIPEMAFGAAAWQEYLGDVGIEPPLPADIQQILEAPCPFWPGKKVRETHLLTLIPQTVNGQPLTLKTLGELVQKPRKGQPTKYAGFYLGEYADPPAPASHWALLSRDVIPGSRNKSYATQLQLVQQHPGYVVPQILDATVSIFIEYLKTGTRLYRNEPWTYTRCQEKYGKDKQSIVGGFAPFGLDVTYYPYSCFDDAYVGVGALRKF